MLKAHMLRCRLQSHMLPLMYNTPSLNRKYDTYVIIMSMNMQNICIISYQASSVQMCASQYTHAPHARVRTSHTYAHHSTHTRNDQANSHIKEAL